VKLPNEENAHLAISAVLQVLAQYGIQSDRKADMFELRRDGRTFVIAARPLCSHLQIVWLGRMFSFDPEDFYARLRQCGPLC